MGSVVASTLASQIQAAVVGYQLYEATSDPAAIGYAGLAEALPFILMSPLAGHVADKHDRKRITVSALAILVLSGILLGGITLGRLPAARFAFFTYVVIIAAGFARSMLQPSRLALSADIVPRALYPRAIALRTGAWQLGAVIGPALGGTLYATLGPARAHLVAAALYGGSCLCMGRIVPPAASLTRAAPPPFAKAMREGFAFLRAEKVLLPAIALDLFAVLFGGAVALLPVFARDILQVGPFGYGNLRAASAIGAVAMTGLLAVRPPLKRAGRALLLTVAAFGLCMIGFALSRWFWLSMVLLALSGAVDMVSVLIRSTLLQIRVPPEMMGRITSINQVFVGSSNEIGAFESGLAAKWMGTVPSVLFGGSVTLLVVLVTAWRAPALRRLGRLDDGVPGLSAVLETESSGSVPKTA